MSTISASTTSTTGFKVTSDTTGTLVFQTGASPTTAVTIDTAQNMGLGVTPSYRLDVQSTGGTTAQFYRTDGTYVLALKGTGTSSTGALGMSTNDMVFLTNGSERMRLDASGNLGIGTTSPAQRLHVQDATQIRGVVSTGSNAIQFWKDSTPSFAAAIGCGTPAAGLVSALTFEIYNGSSWAERARIDSSGNLLVGTTTSDARVRASGTGTVGRFVADGGSYTGNIISADTTGTAAGTGFNLILLQAGGANQFRVRGDGTIYAQNTSVQSISDVRIKENIVDSTDGLEVVTALRPVRFDFKEKFGNNRKNQLGFIAQEVEAVFPDAVDVWGESDDSNDPYKSVGAGALIPVLVKAIQEQQAIIETLTNRITALEAK